MILWFMILKGVLWYTFYLFIFYIFLFCFIRLVKYSFQYVYRSGQLTNFLLRTMASDLVALIFIPAVS